MDDNGTVLVPLSGTGVTGTLSGSSPSFEPQPYFFGVQERDANISNLSAFAAAATVVTITGPDAAFFSVGFNGCQFVLPPGGRMQRRCQLQSLRRWDQKRPAGIEQRRYCRSADHSPDCDRARGPRRRPLSRPRRASGMSRSAPSRLHGLSRSRTPATTRCRSSRSSPLGNAAAIPALGRLLQLTFLAPAASCSSPSASSQLAAANARAPSSSPPRERPGLHRVLLRLRGSLPDGSVAVTGAAAAGSQLTCAPTAIQMAHLRLPMVGKGGDDPAMRPVRGSPLRRRCRQPLLLSSRATNSVGAETVTLAPECPDLTQDPLRARRQPCRAIGLPHRAGPRATEAGQEDREAQLRKPTTPGATFRLDSPGLKMQAMIDGQPIAAARAGSS